MYVDCLESPLGFEVTTCEGYPRPSWDVPESYVWRAYKAVPWSLPGWNNSNYPSWERHDPNQTVCIRCLKIVCEAAGRNNFVTRNVQGITIPYRDGPKWNFTGLRTSWDIPESYVWPAHESSLSAMEFSSKLKTNTSWECRATWWEIVEWQNGVENACQWFIMIWNWQIRLIF